MGYNKDNYNRIREEYNTKYLRAREAADLRRTEVHLAIPAVEELDRAMNGLGLEIMQAAVGGGDLETRLTELRARNEELQALRRQLLTEGGFAPDYTEVKYECALCDDSGFVDFKMCKCMRDKLIRAAYASSGMATLLESQSFENFDLDYHATNPQTLRHMTRVRDIMKQYADTFEAGVSDNLVLFGGTGLGKTHLSTAVARTVIERGFDVYYVSAVGMLSDFEYQRFGNSVGGDANADTGRYYDCDLLIIDDLGTEVNNQFTTSVLYNVINTRLNRRRATIISTNFSQEEFRKRYWDRITSRVLGEYRVLPFVGNDVRAQKLARKS